MRILFVGDVHLADTSPRSRKDNYTEAIFEKLRQIAELSRNYDYVLFLGDIFHKKDPGRNSHALVGGFMDVLRSFPAGRTYSLVGNHDIRDGNMGCLPDQPLGVIFRTGLLKQLDREEIWIDGKLKVQISPLPFSYDTETNPAAYDVERLPGVDYVIRLTHASILPVGLPHLAYKMPHVPVEQIWGQRWDLLVNGHIHHHSAIQSYAWPDREQHYVNVGAIARGALNSWALEQTPKVLGFTVAKEGRVQVSSQWHDLKVRPAAEVFRVEEAVTTKDNKAQLDMFVKSIKQAEGEVLLKAQAQVDLGTLLEDYLQPQSVSDLVTRKVKEYVGVQ